MLKMSFLLWTSETYDAKGESTEEHRGLKLHKFIKTTEFF
jgi:hypothetical protein